jgi:hypothetical protein
MSKEPKTGERVAHRVLDDPEGAAKSGVAVDVIGDNEQKMVVLESDTGREAYDSRELISLGPKDQSSGPVVLRPGHLRAALRRPQAILALILEAVLIGAIVWAALVLGWTGQTLVLLACGLLALGLVMVILLDRDAQRERTKPER